jgi:hypothetical protein
MRAKIILFSAALLGLFSAGELPAQTTPDQAAVDQILTRMTDARKIREDMAQAVASGAEKPAAALLRLKTYPTPCGLGYPAEANFALAAIDIGQRLLALEKRAEAEEFFAAAELPLEAATKLEATPVEHRVQFLRELALVRADYLAKAKEAKADLEAAIALQPDDQSLQAARRLIASGNREFFRDQSKR